MAKVVATLTAVVTLTAAVIFLWPRAGAGPGSSGDSSSRPRPASGALAGGAGASPASPGSSATTLPQTTGSQPPAPFLTPGPVNVYAGTMAGMLDPAIASLAPRVYVPNEGSGTVTVIDPSTFKIVERLTVGRQPEHIAPDWALGRLYVDNMGSGSLSIIDPHTGKVVGTQPVPAPYNLYFTMDGTKAIVVLDYRTSSGAIGHVNRLDFYDRTTWNLVGSVPIPYAGADHLDFTADGRYLLLSTEYTGYVVKVDTLAMKVVGELKVGGLPVDVRLSPDGSVFYVTNQSLNGVSLIDPVTMTSVGFIKTGRGAHGLVVSRDATRLYVSNRLAGSISVIDFVTRKVIATWKVGGSPDMLSVSADGMQLWTSNRYGGTVTAIDTRTGKVLATIKTGTGPHGLVFYPQPGSLSLGHNGVFR